MNTLLFSKKIYCKVISLETKYKQQRNMQRANHLAR